MQSRASLTVRALIILKDNSDKISLISFIIYIKFFKDFKEFNLMLFNVIDSSKIGIYLLVITILMILITI